MNPEPGPSSPEPAARKAEERPVDAGIGRYDAELPVPANSTGTPGTGQDGARPALHPKGFTPWQKKRSTR